MNPHLMTYGQLRAALQERYQRPPLHVPQAQLEDHLAEQVFRPLEELSDLAEVVRAWKKSLLNLPQVQPGGKSQTADK